ncbi:hypothetical protein D9M69_624060 [compost metagenome]
MQLDAVEPRLNGQPGRLRVLRHGMGDVVFGHGPWCAVRLHALAVGKHLAGADFGGRREHFGAGRQVGHMAHAPGVHQLHKDLAAFGVHGVRHQLPALHMRLIEQTRNAGVAQTVG